MTDRRLRARGWALPVAACALMLAISAGSARAQAAPAQAPTDYVIGVGDVIAVSVWGHPDLERTLTVDADGTITLPPVGAIKAAGSTTRQLSDRISDRLATILRTGAPTVTVIIKEFVSQSVYVTGAVVHPGRYGAAGPQPLYDLINLAGGALPNGDLARVTIVRKEGAGPRQFTVDVAAALRNGTEAQLPLLNAGDVVEVPTAVSLVGGIGNGQGVSVLGDVGAPGLYPVGPDEDLWVALSLAGGPHTTSKLSAIKVLTREQSTPTVVTVNLEETLQRGNRRPYMVKPGDVVYVDSKGSSMWGKTLVLLHTAADVANIVAVIRVLANNPVK